MKKVTATVNVSSGGGAILYCWQEYYGDNFYQNIYCSFGVAPDELDENEEKSLIWYDSKLSKETFIVPYEKISDTEFYNQQTGRTYKRYSANDITLW